MLSLPGSKAPADRMVKVLVVDDSDVILHALRTFFEDYNFEVTTCIDGLEGLQKAVEIKPDIIFLDLMMPNFDGLKMLQVKKVLAEIRDIPVIVISANTDKRNVLAAIEAGANKVISKPMQRDIIIKYVNEALGKSLLPEDEENEKPNAPSQSEIQAQLRRYFLNSFPQMKSNLEKALQQRDSTLLKNIIHEMKGAGGTMGFPLLTELSKEIEEKKMQTATEWMFAQFKCEQIILAVKRMEDEINARK